MNNKIVAAIQSSYIPWKGYFDIINSVDEFVLYDDVQYEKNSWRNRNKIKTRNGLMWLTIPVYHQGKSTQLIKDVKISYPGWAKKHFNSIQANYAKARYFRKYRDYFEELYLNSNSKYLHEINYQFISSICSLLGINTKITWSMEYHLSGNSPTERIIDLCKKSNSSIYLSGPRGSNYLDKELFNKNNIKINYYDYSNYTEYEQVSAPFVHEVSIIDLILCAGPDSDIFLKSFPVK